MLTHSTCADCGDELIVTNMRQTVHPGCTAPPLTPVQQLTRDWLVAAQVDNDAEADRIEALIDAIVDAPPRLGDAAMLYAQWGWPVFPLRAVGGRCDGDEKCKTRNLCQCPKKPATRHGFKDATTDVDRIRRWWTKHPQSNVGLPTGHMFDVIDVDPPIGLWTLEQLVFEKQFGTDVHGRVVTSSGGLHLYVLPDGGGNSAGIHPGIDYRGAGGYVVAPPSTLGRRGRAWSWANKPSPRIVKREHQ